MMLFFLLLNYLHSQSFHLRHLKQSLAENETATPHHEPFERDTVIIGSLLLIIFLASFSFFFFVQRNYWDFYRNKGRNHILSPLLPTWWLTRADLICKIAVNLWHQMEGGHAIQIHRRFHSLPGEISILSFISYLA